MRIDVVTIFPEYLEPLNVSLVGKARANGLLDVRVHDLRDWTHDRHNTVDDTPYGGGPGMVMKTEPWGEALDAVRADGDEAGGPARCWSSPRPAAGPSPRNSPWSCPSGPGWSSRPPATRASTAGSSTSTRHRMPVYEVSIGDYVLAGGEAAVLVDHRGRGPAAARRPRQRRVAPGRLLRPRRHGQPAGRAGLHQAPAVARARHPGGAAQRPPRPHRALAPRRGVPPHRGQPARPDRALRSVRLRQEGPRRCSTNWAGGSVPDGRFGRAAQGVEE